jgi:hypothetical protein
MNNNRKKPYGISVSPDEHRKLKILAAEQRVSMTELVNRMISDLWDQSIKQKEKLSNGNHQNTR